MGFMTMMRRWVCSNLAKVPVASEAAPVPALAVAMTPVEPVEVTAPAPPLPPVAKAPPSTIFKKEGATTLFVHGRTPHPGYTEEYLHARFPMFSQAELAELDAAIEAIWGWDSEDLPVESFLGELDDKYQSIVDEAEDAYRKRHAV